MMNIKYIYSKGGQREAIIVPIEFWNDLFKKFDLKTHLERENYFISNYSDLLKNMVDSKIEMEQATDFYSLFGSWQSEKTGDEINHEIYASRKDEARNTKHFERIKDIRIENWIDTENQ